MNCTERCCYNVYVNYKNKPDELVERQRRELPMVKLAAWTARGQASGKRLFLFENPPTS